MTQYILKLELQVWNIEDSVLAKDPNIIKPHSKLKIMETSILLSSALSSMEVMHTI